ncbi:DNA-3-methyladenine glycosylase [Pararhizobium mangrovi]|uniref:Putative 3-methyladenine DNA glycosylase n=1 Tax=Pararhizobium mangrovi TaxID=2590452 RepID=A0A506U1C4_9HYPH|nr:DNA-3-methyladenine glycosylase [Pararhizobium mangrovi]TPW27041.1 DNA-3-methyladenine glycosylase [Pararhizobium mangrovi]
MTQLRPEEGPPGPGRRLTAEFYERDAVTVARALVGAWLEVDGAGGIIVETEAYAPDDAASHSYGGVTPRNSAMFGPAGHAYVYRSYGLHWCFNVVTEPGSAVLVRALMPLVGIEAMYARRGVEDERKLCSGPGRLTQALAIDGGHDRRPLDQPPFLLAEGLSAPSVVSGPRVGITRDVDRTWRFGLRGTRFVSRAFR